MGFGALALLSVVYQNTGQLSKHFGLVNRLEITGRFYVLRFRRTRPNFLELAYVETRTVRESAVGEISLSGFP